MTTKTLKSENLDVVAAIAVIDCILKLCSSCYVSYIRTQNLILVFINTVSDYQKEDCSHTIHIVMCVIALSSDWEWHSGCLYCLVSFN